MTQTASVIPNVHLIKPTAKMSNRLLRQAVEQVAKSTDADYLSVEERYTSTRSAVAHLMAHERYQITWLKDKTLELVQLTRELLAAPGVEKLSSKKSWVDRLKETTNKLELTAVRDLSGGMISKADIVLFLSVIESNQLLHKNEGLDPSDIVPVNHFVLAQMLAANFKAYE